MNELYGLSVSAGIALGPALLWQPDLPDVSTGPLMISETKSALMRFFEVKELVRGDLQRLLARLPEDSRRIPMVHAQLKMMDQELTMELVTGEIEARLVPPDRAVAEQGAQYINRLEMSADPHLREQAAQLKDLVHRFLRRYSNAQLPDIAALPGPRILVAKEFSAAHLASLDVQNTLALVTEKGSASSHASLVAKGHGIPCVMGVRNLMKSVKDGVPMLVDATTGDIRLNPDRQVFHWYMEEKSRIQRNREQEARFAARKALTKDGQRVYIGVNTGAGGKEEAAAAAMADGVGMLRSEFLFLNSDTPPSEELQYEFYSDLLRRLGPRSVTLRTADLGEDKTPAWLPAFREDTQSFDKRGIRLMLDNPHLLRPQLRAALRAARHGNLSIMFPMVEGLDEYWEAVEFVQRVKSELAAEGEAVEQEVPLGVMIEVPSAALLAEAFAGEVDFAAIGTNDLCQYLLAADRMDPDTGLYYQPFHPVMFRTIHKITEAFRERGKKLSICGELAGDVRAAPVLVGLGVRYLSMSPLALGPVKRRLAAQTVIAMEQLAQEVLQQVKTQDILRLVENKVELE